MKCRGDGSYNLRVYQDSRAAGETEHSDKDGWSDKANRKIICQTSKSRIYRWEKRMMGSYMSLDEIIYILR